jgi:diguanylate cyclase (GGDEF)-like protein
VLNPIDRVLQRDHPVKFSDGTLLIRRDGAEYSIHEVAAPIRDREDRITGLVVVFRDVSGERKIAAQLSYQASHDVLTGLVNRREFENRLAFAFEAAKNFNRQHALLYLDLDQFKIVNDTCGHPAGDQVLRQLSELLRSRLRTGDTLARLGGDEFGVLLENCPLDSAAHIAQDLLKTVSDFRFVWHNKTFRIGVSIGLVTFCDHELSFSDILRAADTSMYRAKEGGRNRIQIYHPQESDLLRRRGEVDWVKLIQEAIEHDRFCLYAQEIIRINGGIKHGTYYELLLRMFDPQGNVVLPMAFIPAAERHNMMMSIDRWVIQAAFMGYSRQVTQGKAAFIKNWIIKLSSESLADEEFLEYVKEQFVYHQIPPEVVCFEITETAAIVNLSKTAQFMRELKSLGCHFCLAGFGNSMSSFTYLKHLPIDLLKIDGAFVKDLAHDPIDRAMVEAINNIAHVMGFETIAEHVEDNTLLQTLRHMGVDLAQGYGIAKPRPFDRVTSPLKVVSA